MGVLGQHVHGLTAEQLDVYQKVSTVPYAFEESC
jgi:hypothetical protein